jgi:hypothetical protein
MLSNWCIFVCATLFKDEHKTILHDLAHTMLSSPYQNPNFPMCYKHIAIATTMYGYVQKGV